MSEDITLQQEHSDTSSLINSIAKIIVDRHLEMPAVLLLEMHKPIAFIAGQAVLVGLPLFAPVFGVDRIRGFASVLNEPENVEALICKIESLSRDKTDKEDNIG